MSSAGWPVGPRDLRVSSSSTLGFQVCVTHYTQVGWLVFMYILEFKLLVLVCELRYSARPQNNYISKI